jgi:hypothetical protein
MENRQLMFDIATQVINNYNLSLEEREAIEIENGVNYYFFTTDTEEIVAEYIKTNLNWNNFLKEAIDEEDFELAVVIREALFIEESDIKRLLLLYSIPNDTPQEEVEDIIEAIEYINKEVQQKLGI